VGWCCKLGQGEIIRKVETTLGVLKVLYLTFLINEGEMARHAVYMLTVPVFF
jgi:hypothetical protein